MFFKNMFSTGFTLGMATSFLIIATLQKFHHNNFNLGPKTNFITALLLIGLAITIGFGTDIATWWIGQKRKH